MKTRHLEFLCLAILTSALLSVGCADATDSGATESAETAADIAVDAAEDVTEDMADLNAEDTAEDIACGTDPEVVEACENTDNASDCEENQGEWVEYEDPGPVGCICPLVDEDCPCTANSDCTSGYCAFIPPDCDSPSDPIIMGTCHTYIGDTNPPGLDEYDFECDD